MVYLFVTMVAELVSLDIHVMSFTNSMQKESLKLLSPTEEPVGRAGTYYSGALVWCRRQNAAQPYTSNLLLLSWFLRLSSISLTVQ